MARRSRMSVQKRLRERNKTEKAELKRELKLRPETPPDEPAQVVATREDLEGYGIAVDPDEDVQDA